MSGNHINRKKFIAAGLMGVGGVMMSHLPVFSRQGSLKKDTVRMGVVGTGKRGRGLINIIKAISGLEVVACCDIIPDNLNAALTRAGSQAKGYTDYEKMLADKNIDAVIVSTPLYLHYPMSVAALEMNKHVYVEKPMAFSIEQSLDLARRGRESKVVFQIGFQYRNYPMYHKVKEVIQQGWLGQVSSFECQYNRNSNWRQPVKDPKLEKVINWRMYKDRCGGPLSELCSHQIDAVNYMTGSHPIRVMGIGSIDFWKDGRETYDHIRTIYEYENGVKATYTSVLSNAFNGYQIRILGNKATIEIGRDEVFMYAESKKQALGTVDGVTGATILNATQGEAIKIPYLEPGSPAIEPTQSAFMDFYDCIVNTKMPQSNANTANISAIAICMGLNAMETGDVQYWKPEYSV